MNTAFKLSGFFAAHAIWCVSDGATLIPMLAYMTPDGEQKMNRLVADTLEMSVAQGKEMLKLNQMGATDSALLYDGRITVGSEKLDAILIEVRSFVSPSLEAILAIPYSPKKSFLSKFRVHKPKVLSFEDCNDLSIRMALESFFEGVAGHDKGAKIWNKCLDESK